MSSLIEVDHWQNNSFLRWSVLLRWKGQTSHVVLPGWGQLGAGINYIRDSQSVVRGLVSSIIYAVRWQHTCFSFWHKLIIWYWINNYSIEYKPDVTSLVSHWKQWISPGHLEGFLRLKWMDLGHQWWMPWKSDPWIKESLESLN